MRIHFLGTGGYHPNERRHTACVMLPEAAVVLDAGTGAFRVAEHVETDELHVFMSHSHLDHIVGLTYFLVPMALGQIKRVFLYGTQSTLDAIRQHLFSDPLFPVLPAFEFVPLADRVTLPDGGVLSHCPLNHPGGSKGFRIDWPDRSLAYITDTICDGTYLDFVHGADVLIHECYFPDSQAQWADKTGHSFTTAVAHLACDAGVGRLFLVHVDPQRPDDDPIGIETARGIFPATDLAEDRMIVEF
ncbi:MAG: metal-dependent hydrolase [Planctomycetaceae bacterium]|nr:metal-dependent hydrolase [Planctomycetaceae bacterium]